MRALPPIPELIAFEAVARHLSFTRAAEELRLTQSAISHRVRRLEQHLGARLLNRLNPGLTLTEAGLALLPELTACLDGLARLGGKGQRRLRVAAGAALCNWWLVARLPAFMAQRPGVSVELLLLDGHSATPPDLDLRILWVAAGDDAPSPLQRPLFSEWVFPVCSPRLLPQGRPLLDRQALCGMTLLHKASSSTGEWSWPLWLQHLGLAPTNAARSELHLAEMSLVLAAAAEGAGVALSRSLLVHDALLAGRLVLPVTGFAALPSSKRHVARWPAGSQGDRDVEAFVDWLVQSAAETVEQSALFLAAANVNSA